MAAISKEIREMSLQPWFPIMMRELGYEPTKHGRWLDVEPAPWGQVYETCSECGIRQTLDKGNDKFCGVCGARMDK